jgi:hypothetical protein
LCIENRAADFQMRIERLACDEEPHNFARTFEDCVHAAIAQKSFHRDWRLATASQRGRSLVSAPAAHLHCVIGNAPRRFRRPHFAHRSFDSQIASLAIEQRRREKRHCFHGENVARHFCNLPGNGCMFADGHAPLNAFAGPFPRDLQQALRHPDARRRQR